MDTDFRIFSIMFPIMFGLLAAFLLVIGLRGILTGKPFLLSNKWLLVLMFVTFIPVILFPFYFALPDIGSHRNGLNGMAKSCLIYSYSCNDVFCVEGLRRLWSYRYVVS